MTRPLVVVGAGGFGRETLDVIEAVNHGSAQRARYDVLGVLDDRPSEENLRRLAVRGVAHLGTVDDWLARGDDAEYVIAVGHPGQRQELARGFDGRGLCAATVVHPSSLSGSAGAVGAGSIICAGAQLSTNVRLGRHVQVNPNATVGHDSRLGDFVSVNPAATISGECLIDSGALIGAASVILQGLTVGAGAVVGAAACVVRDVPADLTVMGVPAR